MESEAAGPSLAFKNGELMNDVSFMCIGGQTRSIIGLRNDPIDEL